MEETNCMDQGHNSELSEQQADLNDAFSLDVNDINTLKALNNPSEMIKKVGEALCILFNIEPTRIPDPSNPSQRVADYWGPSRQLLLDSKFLYMVRNFDKDNINPNIVSALKKQFFENPDFSFSDLSRASPAAAGVYRWIRGVATYNEVSKQIAAKGDIPV